MTAELPEPLSEVRVVLEGTPRGEPLAWVRVKRPGDTVAEELRYIDLMATPSNTEEDRAIKREATRQCNALKKEWRSKPPSAERSAAFEIIRVVPVRNPSASSYDPIRHSRVFYSLNGVEYNDTPASLNKAIQSHPERYPKDAPSLIARAVREHEKSLEERRRPPEAPSSTPCAENAPMGELEALPVNSEDASDPSTAAAVDGLVLDVDPGRPPLPTETFPEQPAEPVPGAEPTVLQLNPGTDNGESANPLPQCPTEKGDGGAIPMKQEEPPRPPIDWGAVAEMYRNEKSKGTPTSGPAGYGLREYTIDPSKKLPLDQLWRWPECFALISLERSVPQEKCEAELLAALERSGAGADLTKNALAVVRKLYGKYALGEDKIGKKARENIKYCGLKVGEDFQMEAAPARVTEPDQEAQPLVDGKGFDLDLAEPYVEEDGSPGVAVIRDRSSLDLKTLDEWQKEQPALGEALEARYFSRKTTIWDYPSRPILPRDAEDVKALHRDIMACVDKYVEHPNMLLRSVFATWTMGSYLTEFAVRSPLYSLFGPTGAGKGQVEDMVRALAYRGVKLINPTPAVLFRWSDRYRLTFALDELNDKDKESFAQIMSFIKGAFDGTPVPRYNSNTDEVELFQTRVFIAPSFKDRHPKEDVKNRGFLVTMHQNSVSKALVPKGDTPEFRALRSRLMGLRLRALSDPGFISGFLGMVEQQGTPEALGLDRRPKDIALSLLLPAIMSAQQDKLIKAIRKSTAEARFDNNSTFMAMVQHTLESEFDSGEARVKGGVENPKTVYYVSEIKARLESDMKAEGDLKETDKLKTRDVTDALKTLGYRLGRGAHNAPKLDLKGEQNREAFQRNRTLYGPDVEDKEEEDSGGQ